MTKSIRQQQAPVPKSCLAANARYLTGDEADTPRRGFYLTFPLYYRQLGFLRWIKTGAYSTLWKCQQRGTIVCKVDQGADRAYPRWGGRRSECLPLQWSTDRASGVKAGTVENISFFERSQQSRGLTANQRHTI